jgi:hypothetical protein
MRIQFENGMKTLRAVPPLAVPALNEELARSIKQNTVTLLHIQTAIGPLPILSDNVAHTLKQNASMLKFIQQSIDSAKQPVSLSDDDKIQIIEQISELQKLLKTSITKARLLFWSIPVSLALLIVAMIIIKVFWGT